MPKIKDYSADAIIGRQQQEYNLWKEKQSQQPAPQPQKDAQNPTQNQGGAASQYNLQSQNQPAPNQPATNKGTGYIPSAPPFMAQGNANIKTILGTQGEEAVYYSGKVRDGWAGTWDAVVANPFKNWARRTYANINNPIDILPSPTAEQSAAIEKRADRLPDWRPFIERQIGRGCCGLSELRAERAKIVFCDVGAGIELHPVAPDLVL